MLCTFFGKVRNLVENGGQNGSKNDLQIDTLALRGRISVACGNIPAPGLGEVRFMRKFAFVGVASGNLQVFREIGCQKIDFLPKWRPDVENGAKMEPKATKMEPKGTQRVQNGAKIYPK